ncbi:uncharacterized protein SPPG_07625 [Spizellomyces punctatus DAOM BR117]|uniref:Sec39 domain-containing protein n=1 Tax=Spizellomyces punctatus (strain DAOM BR117) TaxID=645134 RepID=A0A0L0H8J3_SPIPD|nr:uncharacterized protein SPPG_07625 [Spizellomyces punctatus DAOM BR117]KNC97239.1 hypothetical protein SPPG_07625 [Spizellomyces punctatus DAOM BR117]|eukprot:XP_016605279.1 hypothetical protein SPPG_07625 [Spizellomyces punctatus DAOM BR117]
MPGKLPPDRLGFDREDAILYELVPVSEWLPDDSSGEHRAIMRTPGKITQAVSSSYSSVPQRLLKNIAARLVRTLDGLVVSASVPPALVQLLPFVRSSWILEASPCGEYLAVVTDEMLEIRSKKEAFEVTGVVSLDRDGFPSWRRIAWSLDSQLLAVTGSDGRVQIVRTDGVLMCSISSKTKEAGSGRGSISLPTRPVEVEWEDLGEAYRDPVGFIEPISTLLFVRPERDSKTPVFMFENHHYTHELITITYDGLLRSYLINLDGLAQALPPPSTTSYVPALHGRRSSTAGLSILRESKQHPGQITYYHKFSFRHWHMCVCTAVADVTRGVLLVSGKGVHVRGSKLRDGKEASLTGFISEWKLIWEKPHYQMEGVEVTKANLDVPLDDHAAEGLWGSIRKVFTIDSVLMSIQPSRRMLYLDTIHRIYLSPAGTHLVTLDCGGTVKVWAVKGLELLLEWTSAELHEQLKRSSTTITEGTDVDLRSSNHVNGISGSPTVVSVGWWSNSSITLAFLDGSVFILNLPHLTDLLGNSLQKLRCHPDVVSMNGDRLFILDCEKKIVRLCVRDGVYSPMRATSDDHLIDEDQNEDPRQKTAVERLLSIAARPLRFVTDTFLWHWEDETSPSRKMVTVQRRKYRLLCLFKTTPLEAMRRKIQREDFGAALELAAQFGLSMDEVYKAQWVRAEVSEDSIRDFLVKVENRSWVLRNCLERVPPSPKATKLLLQYGLEQTGSVTLDDVERDVENLLDDLCEQPSASAVQATLDDEQGHLPSTAELCLYRYRFLKYLDRLETHEAIYAGAFDDRNTEGSHSNFAEHFAWFRDCDLVVQAINYATTKNIPALQQLFTRHGREVLPFRLGILKQLPETADPREYAHLLPVIDGHSGQEMEWQVIPWRKPDWTESDTVRDFIGIVEEGNEQESEEVLPTGCRQYNYPASLEVIRDWYRERAGEVEGLSGQVDFALELIRSGIDNNVTGLEDLAEDLQTLSELIYDCYSPDSKAALDLSLDRLCSLYPGEVVRLFLVEAETRTVVSIMDRFVLPFLSRQALRWERQLREGNEMVPPEPQEAIRNILHEWLIEVADEHLDWCVAVFETFSATPTGNHRIIGSRKDLADLSMQCAYRCTRTNALGEFRKLLKSIPFQNLQSTISPAEPIRKSMSWEDELELAMLEINDSNMALPSDLLDDPAVMDDLQERFQRFKVHVEAVAILERYGLARPLSWFLESDNNIDAQRQLVVQLARRSAGGEGMGAGGEHRFESEDEWSGLLDDMLELHQLGVLDRVPRRDIYVEFLSVVLSSGKFRLAKRIMQPESGLPPLPSDVSETLVINAAREFFDNAHSGDMNHGLMKKARDCLKVLPTSPILQTELNLIKATHQLTTRYNITLDPKEDILILPIQIRLHPDRLQLIQQILRRYPDAYNSAPSLLELTKMLLGEQYNRSVEVRAQAMIATAALEAKSYETAYQICEDLIRGMGEARSIDPLVAEAVCKVCMALGNVAEWPDLKKRMKVVGHALALCPTEKMVEGLALWRSLESEKTALDAVNRVPGIKSAPSLLGRLDGTSEMGSESWIFSVEKAIGELERQLLAFEDPGHLQATAKIKTLPRHPFYQNLQNVDSLKAYPGGELAGSTIQGGLLEALMRLRSAHGTFAAGMTQLDDNGEWIKDEDLLSYSAEIYASDAVLAFNCLLHQQEDHKAGEFFDGLPPSPANDLLACYYYAHKTFSRTLSADNRHFLAELPKYAPSDVIRNIDRLASTLDRPNGGPPAISSPLSPLRSVGDWDFDLPLPFSGDPQPPDTIDPAAAWPPPKRQQVLGEQAAEALTKARHYITLMENRRQERMLRSIYDRKGVDPLKFEQNDEYKRAVVLDMARTLDEAVLAEAFKLAHEVGVSDLDVVLSRVAWLFCSEAISASVVEEQLKKYDVHLKEHPTQVEGVLQKIHDELDGRSHAKLLLLYEAFLTCQGPLNQTPKDQNLIDELKNRVAVLRVLCSTSSLASLDLKQAVAAQYIGLDAFVSALNVTSLQTLNDVTALIPQLLELENVPVSPDVPVTGHVKQVPGISTIISTIYLQYSKSLIPTVPWEYMEEGSVASKISQIIHLFDHLLPKDLLALTSLLTTHHEAIGIPVAYRCDIVARAKAIAHKQVQDHITGAELVVSQLQNIDRHLTLVNDLHAVVDDATAETIAPERIQQFDSAFEEGPKAAAIICMRMIIAGTSPVIMHKICCILEKSFGSQMSFSMSDMYEETMWCILGHPRDPMYASVFRRGVDSPSGALERILASIASHQTTKSDPPQSAITDALAVQPETNAGTTSGWDAGEGWDLDTGDGWDIGGIDDSLPSLAVAGDSSDGWDISGIEDLPRQQVMSETQEGWETGDELLGPADTSTSESASGWDLDLPVPVMKETEAAITDTNERLKKVLGDVVHNLGSVDADLRMKALSLLQKYYAFQSVDAQQLQTTKLVLMIQQVWGINVRSNQLNNPSQRPELFQDLLSATETAPQAQCLVAVLTEWLPIPAVDIEPYSVPGYLQRCWRNLFCWMVEHGEFGMFMLTRVEFGGFDILDEEAERMLLQILQDIDLDAEYLKHAFLSRRYLIVHDAVGRLELISATSLERLAADRILHIILCCRGLSALLVGTPLWQSIRQTLLSGPQEQSDDPSHSNKHRELLGVVVSDLTSAGYVSAAAGLTFGYASAAGDGLRVTAFRKILGFAGVDSAGSGNNTTGADYVLEDKIIGRYLGMGMDGSKNSRQ